MPYIIRKSKEGEKKGYKVCKKNNPQRCFSNHPLPLKTAKKQRIAIIISEKSKKK